jgi:hypothetical protein
MHRLKAVGGDAESVTALFHRLRLRDHAKRTAARAKSNVGRISNVPQKLLNVSMKLVAPAAPTTSESLPKRRGVD